MTKINFKRTGGFLGRELDSDIDLNEMPDDDSQELQRMILDTNFFNIPQNLIAPATPDEYEYTVTVDAGNSHHTIHTSDSNAPDSLRPLLEKLSKLAKEGKSNSAQL
ncbi:MAG: protealysin inhibitor emfourin [Syntrophothermus sp.]